MAFLQGYAAIEKIISGGGYPSLMFDKRDYTTEELEDFYNLSILELWAYLNELDFVPDIPIGIDADLLYKKPFDGSTDFFLRKCTGYEALPIQESDLPNFAINLHCSRMNNKNSEMNNMYLTGKEDFADFCEEQNIAISVDVQSCQPCTSLQAHVAELEDPLSEAQATPTQQPQNATPESTTPVNAARWEASCRAACTLLVEIMENPRATGIIKKDFLNMLYKQYTGPGTVHSKVDEIAWAALPASKKNGAGCPRKKP